MNPSPEEFDHLKKLLALKRHEQPPPGFFDHFSDKVIARIEAEALIVPTSWWQRVFPELDAKPVLACAYGLVITGLLVVGLGISESLDSGEGVAPNLGSPWLAVQTPTPAAPAGTSTPRPLTEQSSSSVNPVFSSTAPRSLFDVNRLPVEPASYNFR
jgi:hypothetical protein